MKHQVSDGVRKATTKCTKGFACLAADGAPLCTVEYCVNGEVHFLKCLCDKVCPYQNSFGNGLYCTCPTRKELFNKYKI